MRVIVCDRLLWHIFLHLLARILVGIVFDGIAIVTI